MKALAWAQVQARTIDLRWRSIYQLHCTVAKSRAFSTCDLATGVPGPALTNFATIHSFKHRSLPLSIRSGGSHTRDFSILQTILEILDKTVECPRTACPESNLETGWQLNCKVQLSLVRVPPSARYRYKTSLNRFERACTACPCHLHTEHLLVLSVALSGKGGVKRSSVKRVPRFETK